VDTHHTWDQLLWLLVRTILIVWFWVQTMHTADGDAILISYWTLGLTLWNSSSQKFGIGMKFWTVTIVIAWRYILLLYLWQLLDFWLVYYVAYADIGMLDLNFKLMWRMAECAARLLANYFVNWRAERAHVLGFFTYGVQCVEHSDNGGKSYHHWDILKLYRLMKQGPVFISWNCVEIKASELDSEFYSLQVPESNS